MNNHSMNNHSMPPINSDINSAAALAPVWIGFATLEGWAIAARTDRPAYAMLVFLTRSGGQYGIGERDMMIEVAQPDGLGSVHYCHLRAGRQQLLNGAPFGTEQEQVLDRATGMWRLVQTWLAEKGFSLREAQIAVPNSLSPLEGMADFLAYDPVQRVFYRRDEKVSENSLSHFAEAGSRGSVVDAVA